MAFDPWSLLMLAPSLLQLLFGGNKGDTQQQTQDTTQTTTTPAWQPRDPGYSILSPYLLSMLTQNMGRLSGAGFPGGKGIGGDMTTQLIDLISSSWPDIMASYTKPAESTTTETLETCNSACAKKHPAYNDRRAACLQACKYKFREKTT